MMSPTREQLEIGTSIARGDSVIVNAVAGSGKTTTVLSLATRFPHLRILQITYNTALKLEVRKKVADKAIANVEVHTYHSAARTYYDETTTTDMGIEASLGMRARDLPDADVVVIDECQDMTPLLYAFARKLVGDLARAPVLGLFGDDMQTVYQFKGADPRFLTLGDRLWPEFRFVRHVLSESFRVSRATAAFVNANLLGYEKIVARRPGPPVEVLVSRSASASVIPLIFRLFESGVRASEIFILAPSLAENSRAFVAVENALVLRNIAVHIPNQDDRTLDDDVMRNKIVFSTFHQSKGRERRVAIVLGLDGGYARTYAREVAETACPTTAYVACTRASDLLVLVQQEGAGCPRFMRLEPSEHFRVAGGPLAHAERADAEAGGGPAVTYGRKRTTVTKLVRHLSHELIKKLDALIAPLLETVHPAAAEPVEVPTKVLTKYQSYEDVSEINAFALSAMFEVACGVDAPTIAGFARGARLTKFLEEHVAKLPTAYTKPDDFLYLANVYRAVSTRQYFKLKQIRSYGWITPEQAAAIMANYRARVSAVEDFEFAVGVSGYSVAGVTTDITGSVDIVTATDVFEIKCTQRLQLEHVIQLILYKWLWGRTFDSPRDFKLLNVLTGECVRVGGTPAEIDAIADLLVREKYLTGAAAPDGEGFVEECLGARA